MGRRSKLTETQWAEVGRRLLAGESQADVARHFNISKGAVQQHFSSRIETIKSVANQLVGAEQKLRTLPLPDQLQALNLADELRAISMHLASAAKFGSATAHRLAGIAHGKVQEIDDAAPMTDESLISLKGIAVLTRMANDAASTGLNLLSANKEQARRAETAKISDGLGHFYADGSVDNNEDGIIDNQPTDT